MVGVSSTSIASERVVGPASLSNGSRRESSCEDVGIGINERLSVGDIAGVVVGGEIGASAGLSTDAGVGTCVGSDTVVTAFWATAEVGPVIAVAGLEF